MTLIIRMGRYKLRVHDLIPRVKHQLLAFEAPYKLQPDEFCGCFFAPFSADFYKIRQKKLLIIMSKRVAMIRNN